VKQVGRELGMRYVLEGSVRKPGNRVRITAQLAETETGAHVWADRFDGVLENIFDLQDEITASIVSAIQPQLRDAELNRARRQRPKSPTAYDCFLRGMARYYSVSPRKTTLPCSCCVVPSRATRSGRGAVTGTRAALPRLQRAPYL
jgi:adenylate cyclase